MQHYEKPNCPKVEYVWTNQRVKGRNAYGQYLSLKLAGELCETLEVCGLHNCRYGVDAEGGQSIQSYWQSAGDSLTPGQETKRSEDVIETIRWM